MLTLKRIAELAGSRQTYLRGIALYNAGRVESLVRRNDRFFAVHLAADVREAPDKVCHTELGLGSGDTVEYQCCSCAAFQRSGSTCKHLVAVLVHQYYTAMLGGVAAVPAAAPEQSDEPVEAMLAAYMEQPPALPPRAIRLEPVLHLEPRRMWLTFILRETRPYVLKDLGRFCDAVRERAVVDYGQQLCFCHDPSQFDPACRPWLDFLLRHFRELQTALSENGTPPGARLSRELPLGPGALEELFTLGAGQTLHCVDRNGDDIPCTLRDGDPLLHLGLEPSGEGWLLTGRIEGLYDGSPHLFLRWDTGLYRCTPAFTAALTPLLTALSSGHGRLFIARAELPLFCATALPALDGRVVWEGTPPDPAAFPLPQPQAVIYLDAEGPSRVTARLELHYDGNVVEPLGAKVPDIPRNRLLEQRLRCRLQVYFSTFDPQRALLLCQGEEALFRLLTEGLEELRTLADVMVTDRFRRIGLAPPPPVTVGVRTENHLLELHWEAEGVDSAELAAILQQYRLKKTYYRLRDGRFLALQDERLKALSQLTAGLALSERELARGHTKLPAYRALYLERAAAFQPALPLSGDEGFRRLTERLTKADAEPCPVPASLQTVLRPYQVTGFRWLRRLEQLECGGILADEMGLGKTVQMIALLLDARERRGHAPSLVVCPTSLVLNWESELHRFAPSLRVLPVIGSAEQRAALLAQAQEQDVLVTSYDMLKRDVALYAGYHFRYHILDEAQYIKNPRTQNAQSVKAISSDRRFALTGTPMENRVSELWSLFDFLMPGFLYSYSRFKTQFEWPILREGDDMACEQLRRLVEPFILRRLKSEVLQELPPKTERVLPVSLEEEQRRLYDAQLAQARLQLKEKGAPKMEVLSLLMRLRQLCCDPSLCYENYHGGSAKVESCLELVRQAAEAGHKVLIFSQFTSMLSILQKRLEQAHLAYYRLDGATSKEQRSARIRAFNQDATPVFLISLKAGGTGLNLVGADVVIHFDPWWNLAVQEQATDRAHRIGQKRPVEVIRLIARDTVEERILRLQEKKQGLADALVPVGEGLTGMTAEELWQILEQD